MPSEEMDTDLCNEVDSDDDLPDIDDILLRPMRPDNKVGRFLGVNAFTLYRIEA